MEYPPAKASRANDPHRLLERVTACCPVYARFVQRQPEAVAWLAAAGDLDELFGSVRIEQAWEDWRGAHADRWEALRRFRRLLALRVALREVNGLAPVEDTLAEVSHLADFCLRMVFRATIDDAAARLGAPWDEVNDRPAQWCVLGLGKLGGGELNFCSDVDLILLMDGDGHCRRDGRPARLHNREFYNRAFQEAVQVIQARTAEGFLYNVDLRLRPEGAAGPLVPTLNAIVNYYFTRGQTWERLALLKARRITGDRDLAGEFLEMVHSFRYPRYAPASLAQDVAVMKKRTENEVVGSGALDRDVKSGFGGIREIEFFVQVLQLLNASRFPFLQTGATLEALRQLERYELVDPETCAALREAYVFLRLVENRLQMAEEKALHAIPPAGPARAALAASLGFAKVAEFDQTVRRHRDRVRGVYAQLFPDTPRGDSQADWQAFFTAGAYPDAVRAEVESWFGADPAAPDGLRALVLGDQGGLTREHLALFHNLALNFPDTLAPLANPLGTLDRLNRFARQYGARKAFLKSCSLNPNLFKILCLLFDRSRFIHELLCLHPEIIEELLSYAGRQVKEAPDLLAEMRLGPRDEGSADWLWIYVKAEQVRIAINGLMEVCDAAESERQLSALAEAALIHCLGAADPDGMLAVVGLGKFGSREITLGSDLDLLVLGPPGSGAEGARRVQALLRLLGHAHSHGKMFEADLRLRPHGQDGPLVTTLDALRAYHQGSAGFWEVLMLTRARPVAGNPELCAAFSAWRDELLFGGPPPGPDKWAEMDAVRARVQREKVNPLAPECSFKACAGGLLDIEFCAQRHVLQHGRAVPALRATATRGQLDGMAAALPERAAAVESLRAAYDYLRALELALRRDSNSGVSEIPSDAAAQAPLARWMGFADRDAFWAHHTATLARARESLASL
jgi:glutamate-ammonia-ligase adenylyltransferase